MNILGGMKKLWIFFCRGGEGVITKLYYFGGLFLYIFFPFYGQNTEWEYILGPHNFKFFLGMPNIPHTCLG